MESRRITPYSELSEAAAWMAVGRTPRSCRSERRLASRSASSGPVVALAAPIRYTVAEGADKTIDEGMNAVDAALIDATNECVCTLTVAVEEDGIEAIDVSLCEVEYEKRAELRRSSKAELRRMASEAILEMEERKREDARKKTEARDHKAQDDWDRALEAFVGFVAGALGH